ACSRLVELRLDVERLSDRAAGCDRCAAGAVLCAGWARSTFGAARCTAGALRCGDSTRCTCGARCTGWLLRAGLGDVDRVVVVRGGVARVVVDSRGATVRGVAAGVVRSIRGVVGVLRAAGVE